MIKCNLAVLMAKKKLKISDLARATGLNRNTITLLYRETATKVDLCAVDKICDFLECEIGDLFERVSDEHKG